MLWAKNTTTTRDASTSGEAGARSVVRIRGIIRFDATPTADSADYKQAAHCPLAERAERDKRGTKGRRSCASRATRASTRTLQSKETSYTPPPTARFSRLAVAKLCYIFAAPEHDTTQTASLVWFGTLHCTLYYYLLTYLPLHHTCTSESRVSGSKHSHSESEHTLMFSLTSPSSSSSRLFSSRQLCNSLALLLGAVLLTFPRALFHLRTFSSHS